MSDLSTFRENVNKIDSILIRALLLIPTVLILLLIIVALRANGQIDYCFIKANNPTISDLPQNLNKTYYVLTGHVSWRDNRMLFSSTDFNEVKDKAKELGCNIK